ncbi:hypothetical protein DYB28_003504 [Aphanomyces astaci]|uniref:Uncharacterized protein n=2 Tax=Aphanomyces astaci TaxID=112090 RepID=A0A9X8DJU7_APHAT|nr:hypothetical protein DYB28_003504 [Aphanomyces astaci]
MHCPRRSNPRAAWGCGFDSDVTFAVTRLGDVYVWGTKHGPTGLPRPKRRNRFDVVVGGGGSSPPPKGALHLPNLTTLDGPEEHVPADVVDPVDPPDNSSDESSDDGSSDDNDADADALHDDKVGEGENMVEDESMLVPAPVKLKSISGEDIVQIAVGRVHCAARSKCGDVFTWGQNDHCQLGNEPQHSLSAAQSKRAKIKYGADSVEPTIWSRTVPETCVVRGVAVGTDHTMILSDVGDIYAFGSVYNTTDHSTLSRHLRKHRVHQVILLDMLHVTVYEDQVEAARVEEAARVAAIAKQYEAEERKEELREALIERLQRSRCIEYLNSHHPLCNQCPIAGVCPGFQRDEIDPQLCQQCLHIKQSHNGQHRESNKAMGLDELQVLLERLHVTDDDLDLYIPDDELLIESRK